MHEFFSRVKKIIIVSVVFLFPLFFLPLTYEFFLTHKLYLLAFAGLLLLLVSTIEFIFSRQLVWRKNIFDNFVFLFVLVVGLSNLISSPNKIQALLNANFGLVMLLSLTVLYYYLSRQKNLNIFSVFLASSGLVSILTIVFFFQPFQNINLPVGWEFLNNRLFTPLGSYLDLVIFLGFAACLLVAKTLTASTDKKTKQALVYPVFMVVIVVALALAIYTILKPNANSKLTASPLLFPPASTSWYAAVETLKNPVNALFGVGIDNFSAIFTKVKGIEYNQSNLWQINSFSSSRSGLLHIFTESGLVGFAVFGFLLVFFVRTMLQNNSDKTHKQLTLNILQENPYLPAGLLTVLVFIILPSSLVMFFLLYFLLSEIAKIKNRNSEESVVGLAQILPLYIALFVLSLAVVAVLSYLLGRAYLAEYYFKKSLNGFVRNNVKELYDNQRQAIILNSRIERFRINFSQTNLAIANNIASKASSSAKATQDKQPANQLSEEDRQTIAQAIQTAIAEVKAAVSLNPQKAANWENLALIYRNILTVAQGADSWTISAFQRAIVLDPQNPIYRLNLGGVFYTLENWDDASNLFSQAVSLKPDWSNAHYNLAWASFQKTNYKLAVSEMQNAIKLLDANTAKEDMARAQKELEEFKKKLPVEEQKTEDTSQKTDKQEKQLVLPTAAPTIEPKVKLPENSSPEEK